MPTAASASISNALTKDSRLLMANHAGARLAVASITTTTVTVDSVAELTGTSLYSSSNAGLLVILSGQGAADTGLTAEVTGIAGAVLTVDVDFTAAGSAPALADGDVVLVVPPIAFETFPRDSNTLNVTGADFSDMGLTEEFLTHNTPGGVDVGGDLSFFLTSDSIGLIRLLAYAVGGYDKSASGVHDLIPIGIDDGSFASSGDATFTLLDGNAVSTEVYYGNLASSWSLSFPERGLPSLSISTLGSGAAREIGGAGKEFPSGASNTYLLDDFPCDNGPKFTFTQVFLEKGGSLGDGLTGAVETTVTSVTVNGTKGTTNPAPLGSPYTMKPAETSHALTLDVTRVYEDNTYRAEYFNDQVELVEAKGEDRYLLKAFDPSDATNTIEVDIPRARASNHTVTRNPQGHIVENFTIEAIQSLDVDNCPDTSLPLFRARLSGFPDIDVLAALS